MKPRESTQTPFPMTPAQLLQGLQALFDMQVFRRFRKRGPYLVQGVFDNHH